ncbi:MAG: DUF4214 domain-containing protein [Desulfobacterales bacterium]|nr:DUF4214 domain-containing protein [Desulfobacterales bacterium]
MKLHKLLSVYLVVGLLGFAGIVHAELTQNQVSQLYVSIFGRASEGDGNTYWQTNESDMVITADTMLATDPAKTYFGYTLDDNQIQMFIEFIYENTLGKNYSEDPDGINYWVGELAAGKSKGQVVVALINAAMDPKYSGLPAQDQFINKVEISNYTADVIATVPDVNDLTDFVNFISNVTDDSETVTDAKTAVDTFSLSIPSLIISNEPPYFPSEATSYTSTKTTTNYSYDSYGNRTGSSSTSTEFLHLSRQAVDPEGNDLSYTWEIISGNSIIILGAHSSQVKVQLDRYYYSYILLIVEDDNGNTISASYKI